MKRFWTRPREHDGLEVELRSSRPAPRQDFLDGLVSRLEHQPTTTPTRLGRRSLLAALVATVALVAFAAFGGIGYAASGVSHATTSAAGAVSTIIGFHTTKITPPLITQSNEQRSNSKGESSGKGGGDGKGGDGKGGDKGGGGEGKGGGDDDNPGGKEYGNKVVICHVEVITYGRPPKTKRIESTLRLSKTGAQNHLANHPLDYAGPCKKDR
jgi:hypothetical protein